MNQHKKRLERMAINAFHAGITGRNEEAIKWALQRIKELEAANKELLEACHSSLHAMLTCQSDMINAAGQGSEEAKFLEEYITKVRAALTKGK
jgi:hypothetical protein